MLYPAGNGTSSTFFSFETGAGAVEGTYLLESNARLTPGLTADWSALRLTRRGIVEALWNQRTAISPFGGAGRSWPGGSASNTSANV